MPTIHYACVSLQGLCLHLVYIFKHAPVGGVSFMVMPLIAASRAFNVLMDYFPLEKICYFSKLFFFCWSAASGPAPLHGTYNSIFKI